MEELKALIEILQQQAQSDKARDKVSQPQPLPIKILSDHKCITRPYDPVAQHILQSKPGELVRQRVLEVRQRAREADL